MPVSARLATDGSPENLLTGISGMNVWNYQSLDDVVIDFEPEL